jgi:hypothetical protein
MNCFILFAIQSIHKKQQPARQFSRQPGQVSGEPNVTYFAAQSELSAGFLFFTGQIKEDRLCFDG